MSNATKAAEDIKSLVSRLKGFIDVAETLERIGSIEQSEREAVSRKEKAIKEAIEAENKLSIKNNSLSKVDSELKDASDKAQSILENSKSVASKIIDESRVMANGIIKGASEKELEIKKQNQQLLIEKQKISNEIAAAKNELNDINDKIEEAKKKVASLFVK